MIDAVETLRALSIGCSDVSWERSNRVGAKNATHDTQIEALSQALHFNGWAKVFLLAAQAIEAGTAKTEGLGPQDESASPRGCAQ
jgi:hypothetical protein